MPVRSEKPAQPEKPAENNIQTESFGGGRSLADPLARWKDDTGVADQQLMLALKSGKSSDVVQALRSGRIFIALAKSGVDPEASEKTSDMSVVCITSTDGRIGLLAFTSVESLAQWNAQARPIPITGTDAAIAALDESAQALIIDPAGPIPFTLTLPDVVELSGMDQRQRAIAIIESLLTELTDVNIHAHSIYVSAEGPVVLEIDPRNVEAIQQLLAGRSDIHAYAPSGIALIVG